MTNRIVGSLRSVDGVGVVRMEDRFDTDLADLWDALTSADRLAHWLGEITGELRIDGDFRARFFASGWQGTGRVTACEPPHRLLVLTVGSDDPEQHAIEVSLTADGAQTVLVLEERGMPPELLAEYGAGIQVHVEDLAAHLAGRDRCDSQVRWAELLPDYRNLAAAVDRR